MNHCKKCGNEVKENAKFCTHCGAPNNSDDTEILYSGKGLESEEYKNNINDNSVVKSNSNINNKSKKSNLKIIIPLTIFMLIVAITGVFVFTKINASQKENTKTSIEILSVDTDKYPNIVVSIKATNYKKSLDIKNFTLKENDAFQKDLSLSKGIEENQYKISYKTSDESTHGERNIKVACLDSDKEDLAEYSYKAPEKTQSSTQTSNSNNVVDTYDHNEIDVKQALENYENSYIRMVNSKNIDYVKSSIDLSGTLISEFSSLIKSFTDQQITEDLMEHKIEDIKKINNSQYEVTVYEKYYISYGKQRKSSYTDFRTNYIVNKTNSGFKVYSIKNTVTLGSKTNP